MYEIVYIGNHDEDDSGDDEGISNDDTALNKVNILIYDCVDFDESCYDHKNENYPKNTHI